ncbi:Glutaredoxin-3 [Planctomycetes bacterium Pla163]|jgi:glutaredoxin 3|uniref:Glutaredoxin-3 n=1 Tax=Rohdeia mirabilis TaxID=2528008 RepID=A0A518D3Z4_9BACT|nr:Glutaredoxin-3 [Planctomycetes bacterium Pla163]
MAKEIEIYTWTTCPFCVQAKAHLNSKGLPFTEYVMDGKDIELNAKKREYDHWTVPIVVVDGVCIGGATELRALDRAGGLD